MTLPANERTAAEGQAEDKKQLFTLAEIQKLAGIDGPGDYRILDALMTGPPDRLCKLITHLVSEALGKKRCLTPDQIRQILEEGSKAEAIDGDALASVLNNPASLLELYRAISDSQNIPVGWIDTFVAEADRMAEADDGTLAGLGKRGLDAAMRQIEKLGPPEENSNMALAAGAQAHAQPVLTNERRFAKAAANANDGLWYRELDTGRLYVNSRWGEMLELTPGEYPQSHEQWLARLHPDDIKRVKNAITKHVDRKTDRYECEYRMKHRDGRYRWILSRGQVVNDGTGRPIAIAGSQMVTPKLHRHREILQMLMDQAGPALVFVKNCKGEFKMVNRALAEAYGLSSSKLVVGKNEAELCRNLEQLRWFKEWDAKALESDEPIVIDKECVTTPKGRKIWLRTTKVRTRLFSDTDEYDVLGFATDITALVELENLLTQATNNIPVGFYIKRCVPNRHEFIRVNTAQVQFFFPDDRTRTHRDVCHKTDFDFFDHDTAQQFQDEERELLRTGKPIIDQVKWSKVRLPDGQFKLACRLTTKVLVSLPGGSSGICGISRDIPLEGRPEVLGLALDNLPFCIFWKDLDSRFLGCNLAFAKRHKVASPMDIVGKTDYDITPFDAPKYVADDRAVITKDRETAWYRESQLHDGGTAWLETKKLPTHDPNGTVTGVLGIYQDLTDRLGETYGDIMRVISHSLKTWMHILESNLSLLEEKDNSGALSRMQRAIWLLKEATEIATLSSKLREDGPATPFSICDILKSIAGAIADPRFECKLPSEDIHVSGWALHMQHAILQLIGNALRYARPVEKLGRISLRAELSGSRCHIHVQDNGPGVAAQHVQRLFDYVKDHRPDGTGMGLPYVNEVAKRHGGTVRYETALCGGAQFVLDLPTIWQ